MKYYFLIAIILILVYSLFRRESYSPSLVGKRMGNLQDLSKYRMFYINLERHKTRREFIEGQLIKNNIYASRIEGVDGSNSLPKVICSDSKITPYEIACTLSHLKAIVTAYSEGNESAIIFEDDVSFQLVPYWDTTVSQLIAAAPSDWEILHLSNYMFPLQESPRLKFKKYNKNFSCCGYIINRKGMKKIIDKMVRGDVISLDHNRINPVADELIYRLVDGCYIPNRVFFIPYNDTGEMDSTIHKDHTRFHRDSVNRVLQSYLKKLKQV